MKKHYKKLLIFLFLVLTSKLLFAATWYVRQNATGDGKAPNYALSTLSSAITAASAGDIIDIGIGEFAESGLILSKQLTIQGTKGNKTIFKNTGGTFMTFTASGSLGNNIAIKNLDIEGYANAFVDVPSYTIFSNLDIYGSSSNSSLWNGNVITFANNCTNVNFEYTIIGGYWNKYEAGAYIANSANGGVIFKIPDGYSASNLTFTKVEIYDAGIGFYASQTTTPVSASNVSNVTFNYCEFGNIKYKGILTEKLSGLTINNSLFETVGVTTTGQPAAIDIDLKWQNYSGNVSITNTMFKNCAIPNSGTDLNGAAILIKARDFGSFSSQKATWNGNTNIDRCLFIGNNAGLRLGESFNGSGTGLGENNSQSGLTSIINSAFINNNSGTASAYNQFDIRNVSTANLSINNTFFKRSGTIQNPSVTTTFAAGSVSDVNSNGGTTSITNTNLVGNYLAELTPGTYTGYATFNAAFAAVPAGGSIYLLEDLSTGGVIPSVTTSKSFSLYGQGYVKLINNITINSGAELTLFGNFELNNNITNVNDGKLIIPDYTDLSSKDLRTSAGNVYFSGNYGRMSLGNGASTNLPKITGVPLYLEIGSYYAMVENLTVKNLGITGADSLAVKTFTLTILEDLIDDGEINAENGTVKFSGNGTIAKVENYISAKNLIIDRAAGIEVTNGIGVFLNLSLKNGDIYPSSTTNNNLNDAEIVFGPSIVIDNTGPTPGSIVVNNNYDAELTKGYSASNLSFTFPMATYIGGVKRSIPFTINLNPSTVFEDNYNGVDIGYVYVNFIRGLNANAPSGTTKYAGFSWNIEDSDLSNIGYNSTFGYDENTFNGGLTETELTAYRYNGITNPPIKRYIASNGLVKNTSLNTLSLADNKFGEFMFLADNGTTPTTTVDFPVINVYKQKGYSTIQAAIDNSTTVDYDLISIAAGTYIEKINITKSLRLEGNNAGIEPWNWSKPATIIKPNNTTTIVSTALITLNADNVSIDGISFDGTNDLLNDATPTVINGQSNRIATAIYKASNSNYGYDIKNNKFSSFSRGISLSSSNGQNNLIINKNSFDNIINNVGSGFGILSSNFGADINYNRFTRCDYGILVQYTISSNVSLNIDNNQISAYRYGIANRGFSNSTASTIILSNNNISKADYSTYSANGLTVPTTNVLQGISLTNLLGDNDILIESNTVTGADNGLFVTGLKKSSFFPDRFKIINGTYSNNRISIYDFNTGNTNYSTRVVIDGATITNSGFAGILNENATSTGSFVSEMVLKGATLINQTGASPTGYDPIQIFGAKAILKELNDTKISGGDANFIRIIAPAMTGLTVDAKNVTFDGTVSGQTFNNYKPSQTFDLTLRTAVKARIFDGEDVGNTTAGIVTIPITLPVTLISFNAKAQTQGALLTWVTASETNNKHFILEKSLDGKTFSKITQIAGKGNFSGVSNYQYLDNDFKSDTYYRIKQVDFNGTETVYNDLIKFVKGFDKNIEFTLYPNPAQSKITVNNAKKDLVLLDINGRVLQSKSKSTQVEFDIQNLNPGLYFIKSGEEKLKFIKQ